MTLTAQYYRVPSATSGKLGPAEIEQELQKTDSIVWVDLVSPDDNELSWLTALFELPAEMTAALSGRKEMPPLIWKGEMIVLNYNRVQYDAAARRIEDGPFQLVVHPRCLVTVHGPSPDMLGLLRRQWHEGRLGEYALAYSWFLAVDAVVNSYQDTTDALRTVIDTLTTSGNGGSENIGAVRVLRQQLNTLQRYLRPLRSSAHSLQVLMQGELSFTLQKEHEYYTMAVEHANQVREDIHTCLNILNEIVQAFQSAQAEHLNALVYRLTLITIILATFQVIVGIFAVDLTKIVPGLRPIYGALIMLGVLAASAAGEALIFRKKGWLTYK
jgi:Mg2+ and Co2+ transporter CorA